MHQLILNAFPNHFQFNSVYAMQPFYTPEANRRMLTKQKKADDFNFDAPTRAPAPIVITSHATLKKVLEDKKNFKVPWGPKMSSLANYMLASDTDAGAAQRDLVGKMLYGAEGAFKKFAAYTEDITAKLLKSESYQLGKGNVHQVDVVKRFVQSMNLTIPTLTIF